MDDYIKRSDAIKETREPWITRAELRRRICSIPAADVRPVKRGEWIPETDRHYHWHCSECGYVIGAMRMDADFCLKCGADMTGGADG